MSECTSWIITCATTGLTFEIFNRENMEKAKECPFWTVETAAEYLGRINADIRQRS